MKIGEIIDLIGADTLSATFSSQGLKFLSLKPNRGDLNINLALVNGNWEQNPCVQQIFKETVKFFETGQHDMLLDLTNFTSFQQSVFEVVRIIEPGKVVTYKDIAGILGKPGAVRAVGNAVAKNPVAYFLPTHRVLPQKGIGICRTGAGHLREKLLTLEGHDLDQLRGNYVCTRKKCHLE